MIRAILLVAFSGLLRAETGDLTLHMILHAIGSEHYELAATDAGLVLSATSEYADRGMSRSTSAVLRMKPDYSASVLEVKGKAAVSAPGTEAAFAISGAQPFAVQMALMRYWAGHGKPKQIAVAGGGSIAVERRGPDSIVAGGRTVTLERYTVDGLMFGREIVWMDAEQRLAAAMTFAGGLPMEAVRNDYLAALPQLYKSGVAQEMVDLDALAKVAPAERSGAFAIVGATLIDATGRPPVRDAVVIVRNGRISAAGTRAQVAIPQGMARLDASGQTLLPGLWEMHVHFSGVEFGPALLAAGITTARDCGGEFDYLVAQRDAVEKRGALGPRLLLAGLVDDGGPKAFGHVTAATPDEGRAAVRRYHEAGFQQMKLYTYLQPDVIRAICDEAHKLGMTVTGHVPQVFNAFQGVEAGMDQINHLNYVANMMRDPSAGRVALIDVHSETAQKAIRFFKDHHTVVDPTAGWGEMSGHSKEVDVASFEPGILRAPLVLDTKFRGMGSAATTAEQMHARMAQTIAVIGALHKAGVTIVPGSDTGLVGFGLLRELEIYVQAGMTPMEAIECATIVPARAMGLDRDSGTIEPGKRADLILVNGDPATNVSDLRKVTKVIANGRLYDSAKLWSTVGFH